MMVIIALVLVAPVAAQTTITGVTILGTPAVGTVLTAVVTPSGSATGYQWYRIIPPGSTAGIIPGAIYDTYTPGLGDIGYNIYVTASNSDSSATSPQAGPVLASIVTVNTAAELETNVSNPVHGEIIILEPGIYYANDMTVADDKIIEADTAHGHGPWDTIIDGSYSGNSIFTDPGSHSLSIDNLTLQNGVSANGGAIYTFGGSVTVTSSTFTGCTASSLRGRGGAIYAGNSVTVTSGTFTGCSASGIGGYGGAIAADSVTATSSTFTGCTAGGYGGAIYADSVTATFSTFTGCTAGGYGGAIYASGGTIHFCRIYHDNFGASDHNTAFLNASDTWWGTNNDPSGYAFGRVTTSPYLVLGISSSPATMTTGGTSTISANLTYDSNGMDTSGSGTVPDGTPVTFTASGGSISPHHAATDSGVASTTFTPSSTGTAYITATVDGQSVTVPVTVTSGTSGAATSIVIDPATPADVYAGVDGLGIYRSTDSGGSWTGATSQPANTHIKALVVNPASPTHLFAATYGGGVYQSSDSGTTWTACPNTNLANLNVLSLVANPTGTTLYAGTEAGVYTSPDCGSWTLLNNGLP